MSQTFYGSLSYQLSLLLENADDYNVIIQVGENENMKEFRAHSVILRARSTYFKNALSSDWIKKKDDIIIYKKPNISPTVFEMILQFLYTGEFDLYDQCSEDIFNLLIASDELLLDEIYSFLQNYLIEKRSDWIKENFFMVLYTSLKLVKCTILQNYCFESICGDIQSFITSKEFPSLNQDALIGLLKYDEIEGINVWDILIKWGVQQVPELKHKENQHEWTIENYEDLKITLKDLIPFIKFLEINSKDFFYKVMPYASIIPDNIYKEVMEYYLVEQNNNNHDNIIQIKSTIIESKHINIMSNWIDKKKPTYTRTEKDPIYKFKLNYRGSRDGILTTSFRRKCKGQIPSLVLIKLKYTNKIFGGYSSVGFNSTENDFSKDNDYRKFYESKDNFIFSYKNDEDIKNIKIYRVKEYNSAILESKMCGFNFGFGSLYMIDKFLHVNNNGYYEKNTNLGKENCNLIEEIETFTVL